MIRHADYGDISQLKEIWSEAFGEEDYADEFYARIFRPEDTLCDTESGLIKAMLHKIPCHIMQGSGELEEAYYLFALATRSKYRGRGIMGELIERACAEIRSQGVQRVLLIPAQESLKGYYQRFGFVPHKVMPVFEMHYASAALKKQPEIHSNVTLERLSAPEAADYLSERKWKTTNRNVYFPHSVEAFCVEWALKEEQAVFYKVSCRGIENGFLLGKKEDRTLQVSVYGMDYPCWLQIGEALSGSGITALRIPAIENPCGFYFRELNENGGFPVSVLGGAHTASLHGLIPI